MKTSRRYWLISALASVGVVVSAMLSYHYYALRSGLEGFKSYCNLSATFNCDVIASSRYSELFAGLPLSSFAGGWYLAIAIVALFGRDPFWKRETDRALFVMTGFAALISTFYLSVMALILKTYCINCLLMDAVGFSTFLVALSLKVSFKNDAKGKNKSEPERYKTFAGIAAACMLMALVGLKSLDPLALDSGKSSDLVQGVLETEPLIVNGGTQHINAGNGAKIVIHEFLDFQCPSCRIGAQTMTRLIDRYRDRIQVTLRNFPLDPSCNPGMKGHAGHTAACEAARAAYCVHAQGKFHDVYVSFFENQESFVPGKPTALARAIPGIDEGQLLACMESGNTRVAITADLEEGTRLGVQSTPTFFVNGRKIMGAYPLPVWIKIIEALK